jgi:predicted RNA-binding Zn-ribbon protein involved in translation (DUF1610 family)
MVKVVGQDTSVVKRATCRQCGAVNEYLPNEVRELYRGKDISGCREGQDGFNCGQCGNQVITRSW